MSECKLCDNETSILAVTGMQIPVGERCYSNLLKKGASWESETKLKMLRQKLFEAS